jgi:ABC-2 type transport system permease protein
VESKNYIVPSSLAIIITIIGTLLTAMVVAREWERGTMEATMATPVRIQEIIMGKLLPLLWSWPWFDVLLYSRLDLYLSHSFSGDVLVIIFAYLVVPVHLPGNRPVRVNLS